MIESCGIGGLCALLKAYNPVVLFVPAVFLRVNGSRFLDELLLRFHEYLHMNRAPVVERMLFA
jgi:hypothetical protein